MEYSEKDSLLFYAVALVYDIGLLEIDNSILCKETISEVEFELIKEHVNYSGEFLKDIPPKFKGYFIDAIKMHHENLDGSGYPMNLTGIDIPYLPRVLRVVESYVSIISARGYKIISDKETALLRLKKDVAVYDQNIVYFLDRVI